MSPQPISPTSVHRAWQRAPPLAESYDIAVIGAGAFGSWTAHRLRQSGYSVALVDAYGPGNSRSSSGGETRIIRMGYGEQEVYTQWSQRSLQLWTELFDHANRPELFQKTGVLWTPSAGGDTAAVQARVLQKFNVPFELLTTADLAARFPQIRYSSDRVGILETTSGVLLARRAVRAVVEEAVRNGVDYFRSAALP